MSPVSVVCRHLSSGFPVFRRAMILPTWQKQEMDKNLALHTTAIRGFALHKLVLAQSNTIIKLQLNLKTGNSLHWHLNTLTRCKGVTCHWTKCLLPRRLSVAARPWHMTTCWPITILLLNVTWATRGYCHQSEDVVLRLNTSGWGNVVEDEVYLLQQGLPTVGYS